MCIFSKAMHSGNIDIIYSKAMNIDIIFGCIVVTSLSHSDVIIYVLWCHQMLVVQLLLCQNFKKVTS